MTSSSPAPPDTAAFIDSHWDFNDPGRSEQVFRSLLEREMKSLDPEMRPQLRTQLARALGLQRRFDEAHAVLDELAGELTAATPLAAARSLLERGRVYNSSGRPDLARPLFEGAWERGVALGADFYAVDAAHMLAIVETGAESLRWSERALEHAGRSRDERARGWEASLCNNIGWSHQGSGDFARALEMFERALAARRRQGRERDVRVARWCVARCLRSLGRLEEALTAQRSVLAETEKAGDPAGFEHEEVAECLHALGRTREARTHFAKAHEILSRDAWLAEREPARLSRLAELAQSASSGAA